MNCRNHNVKKLISNAQMNTNSNNDSRCDIALIHPPGVFQKEKYAIFSPPWSLRHVGSTSYIGRYPIGPSGAIMPLGFTTMKNFIEDNSNYSVNIFNFSFKFDVLEIMSERFKHIYKGDKSIISDRIEKRYASEIELNLKDLRADLFAVSLHWLNFSQGAIQILKLLKQAHPRSYTVMGGLTATYFKDEIMNLFPFIDFLIAGDGCIPLLKLIEQIKGSKHFFKVPNLLYREGGEIKKGPKRLLNDFKYVQKDDEPFNPISAARGCPLQCITCGGSKYASQNLCNYVKIQAFSVESIMRKLFNLVKQHKEESRAAIFLIHDPFVTLGKKSWEALLKEIKRSRLNVRLRVEFFLPHSAKDISHIAENVPGSLIDISPESMDVNVRTFHKNLKYPNRELIMNMDVINNIDSLSMGIWFLAGLARDTKQSIDKTLSFIKSYYKKIKNKKENIIQYNELLFIDPGSLAFDSPDKYGYELINRSFLSHMQSFEMPIFKYQINYRTRHCTRDQIFALFLYMHNKMNKIYYENDIIDKQLYDRVTLYNKFLKEYATEYDKALLEKNIKTRNKYFEKIGNSFRSELEK